MHDQQQQQQQGSTGVEQQQQLLQDAAIEFDVQLGVATDPGEQQQAQEQGEHEQGQGEEQLGQQQQRHDSAAAQDGSLAAAEEAAGAGSEEVQDTARAVVEDAAARDSTDAIAGAASAAAVAGAEQQGNSTAEGLEVGAGGRLKSPYQLALENCQTLACLKEAAKQKRYRGQFLFPHFLIIGWQASWRGVGREGPCGGRAEGASAPRAKALRLTGREHAEACSALRCDPACLHSRSPPSPLNVHMHTRTNCPNGPQKCATTSLFHHLKDHPAVLTPSEKVLHSTPLLLLLCAAQTCLHAPRCSAESFTTAPNLRLANPNSAAGAPIHAASTAWPSGLSVGGPRSAWSAGSCCTRGCCHACPCICTGTGVLQLRLPVRPGGMPFGDAEGVH